jgi:hypothetical protein
MTMRFRTVKTAVKNLLGAAAAGRYTVAGYQDQGLAADETADSSRLVQVFYSEGDFPKSSSGYGPFTHDLTIKINLIVSEAAGVDLTILDNPAATPAQIAAALAALTPAAERADDSLDELFDHVCQELMKGDNRFLGITSFSVASLWFTGFKKEQLPPRGEYAVLAGTGTLTLRVEEDVVSTDTEDLEFIDNTLNIQDDLGDNAGTVETY